jgi:hypothetical protein
VKRRLGNATEDGGIEADGSTEGNAGCVLGRNGEAGRKRGGNASVDAEIDEGCVGGNAGTGEGGNAGTSEGGGGTSEGGNAGTSEGGAGTGEGGNAGTGEGGAGGKPGGGRDSNRFSSLLKGGTAGC